MQKSSNFADNALVSSGLKIKKKFDVLRAARIGSVYVPDASRTNYVQLVIAAQNFLVPFNKAFGEGENGIDVRISIDASLEKSILEQAKTGLGDAHQETFLANAKIVVLVFGQVDANDSAYVIGMMPYTKLTELREALQRYQALDTSSLGMLVLASGESVPNNTVLATLWKNYH